MTDFHRVFTDAFVLMEFSEMRCWSADPAPGSPPGEGFCLFFWILYILRITYLIYLLYILHTSWIYISHIYICKIYMCVSNNVALSIIH